MKGCQNKRYRDRFFCEDHRKHWDCPYRDTEIIVGTSLTYYCRIQGRDKCVSQESLFNNYKECSYYLFPEPLCKNYDKKVCIACPCDKFEKKEVRK